MRNVVVDLGTPEQAAIYHKWLNEQFDEEEVKRNIIQQFVEKFNVPVEELEGIFDE